MPIYAYRCSACGHARDVLQKISDAPLTLCPACGAQAFSKQVTAAGFQLKGTGWYATDFSGRKASAPSDASSGTAEQPAAAKTQTPSAGTTGAEAASQA